MISPSPIETSVQAAFIAAFGCLTRHGFELRLVSAEGDAVKDALRRWIVAGMATNQQKTLIAAE